MIVTYLLANKQVISITMGFPTVWEENNQLLIKNGVYPMLNDLTKTGWGYYKDKTIDRYAPSEVGEDDEKIMLYLYDLDLEPITADDLPRRLA